MKKAYDDNIHGSVFMIVIRVLTGESESIETTKLVSKFQNENMKSSHCPKYERKNLKNSALSIQGKIFQIFRSYFGQCDDFILSF